jgi:cobalt-zinc-cadmium efflux system membrane fusion protein
MPSFAALLGAGPPPKEDWCSEHSVPHTQCVECKDSLLPRPKAHGWCRKHGVHECPLCHPDVAQMAVTPTVSAEDLARAKRALAYADRPENNKLCKLHKRR